MTFDQLFTAPQPIIPKRGVHLDLKGLPPTARVPAGAKIPPHRMARNHRWRLHMQKAALDSYLRQKLMRAEACAAREGVSARRRSARWGRRAR